MGVRIWVMATSAWALAGAPALAGGPELAGAPPPAPYAAASPVAAYGYGYQPFSPPVPPPQQQQSYVAYDSYGPPSAYPAPGQAYAWATGYGFRGYDQAVYAAAGQARYMDAPPPGPPPVFQGYDQAVYAAEGEARYAPDRAGGDRHTCPRHRGERVVHCDYTPYAAHPQDLRVSGPFDGGVGQVPGGWSSRRSVVIVGPHSRAYGDGRASAWNGYNRY